jgi:hypothetical protein
MLYTQFHDPRIARWQARLARVPRWVWIVIFIGMMIPVIALGVAIVAVGLVTVAIVMTALVVVSAVMGIAYRLMHRRQRLAGGTSPDGRSNVQIVVHSARVIDHPPT